MVGAQDSISMPNVILNTIVAEAFKEACDELEQADDFDMALSAYLRKLAKEHQRIIFNGDGYSNEWVKEAGRRGLPNIRTMVEAIPALTTPKAVELFGKFNVFNESELQSRAEILYEIYAKAVNIEARAMINITHKTLIPSVIKYVTSLANSINAVKAACGCDISVQTELLTESSSLLSQARKALQALETATDAGLAMNAGKEQAEYYSENVTAAMTALRAPIDKLEIMVDKSMWPMPSYGDLIFEV